MIWGTLKSCLKKFWGWLKRKLAGALERGSNAAKRGEEQSGNEK